MYLLRLALRPWRIAPWSQLLSAAAVGVLLLLTGFIVWLHEGMAPVIARLSAEQVVTAYLAPSVDREEEKKVVDAIRTTLGSQAVRDVSYVDSEGFLGALKERYPELVSEVESLGLDEAEAVTPRYVSIAGVVSDEALQTLRELSGVEQVESSKDRYGQVIVAFQALTWVARLFIGGLLLSLLTGLVHLSRVNALFYRDVLTFLRLWGARRSGTILPGALSGLAVGVLGGVIGLAGWLAGSGWLATRLRELSPVLDALPAVSPQIGGILFASGAVLGTLAGCLAGWLASSTDRQGEAGGLSAAKSSGGRAWL